LGTKAANGNIASVELLGSEEKVSWTQQADALLIKPSKSYPSTNAVVYKILFK
jgi:type IV secretory pathway VirB9-like protein